MTGIDAEGVRQFSVAAEDDGIRLDRWFKRHLPDTSFTTVAKWARTGQLRVGGGEPWRLFLGVGVLGGFTTFSSFSLDAVSLWQRGATGAAGAYVALSVIGSIAALFAGLSLTRVAA